MIKNDLHKAFTLNLPKSKDKRGNLSFLEIDSHVPFPIKRVEWIKDIPRGQKENGHASKIGQEILIPLSGSFDVVLHDGKKESTYSLDRADDKVLYIPPMTWRYLRDISSNAICLILSSDEFSEDHHIQDFNQFIQLLQDSPIPTINRENRITSSNKKINNNISDCSSLDFLTIKNKEGNITSVETGKNLPFDIKRIFYIYDIPDNTERGMHAHMNCHEALIAVTGSFEVELDDSTNKRTVKLDNPDSGLHIPPGIWSKQKNYSQGVTCLVLASGKYDKEGYIDSYEQFETYRKT